MLCQISEWSKACIVYGQINNLWPDGLEDRKIYSPSKKCRSRRSHFSLVE